MAIKVGDRVPNGSFTVMTGEGPKPMSTDELFKGKKVVLFAVPGAFTPTCHKNHLPGFVKNAASFKAKGVDTIAVTGVNDVTERGLGVRSQRYAMLVEDGVVKKLNIEDAPGKADISGAENMLKAL